MIRLTRLTILALAGLALIGGVVGRSEAVVYGPEPQYVHDTIRVVVQVNGTNEWRWSDNPANPVGSAEHQPIIQGLLLCEWGYRFQSV